MIITDPWMFLVCLLKDSGGENRGILIVPAAFIGYSGRLYCNILTIHTLLHRNSSEP